MSFSSRPAIAALLLALSSGAAMPARAAADAAAIARIVGAPRFDAAAVERLYWQAVIGDGAPALYRELEAVAASARPPAERATALLASASVHWQAGESVAAMALVDRAIALSPGADAALLKARLLDAAGQPGAAADWYRKALSGTADIAGRTGIQLRLSIAAAAAGRPADLIALSRAQPPVRRNRQAIVLALLGHPGDAVDLYRATGTGPARYADDIRVANWALAAGAPSATAADHAWSAYQAATTPADQRYALALLIEAFRNARNLAGAVAFLDGKPSAPEIDQVRVDLLLELRRYDAAVALVTNSTSPELRRRLIGVLDIAGRAPEIEAEYRRLIAQAPDAPETYEALAALYLGRSEQAKAVAVFRQLFAANRTRIDVLTDGARRMIAMGLSEPAMALLAEQGGNPAFARPTKLFLVETYLDQGQDAAALALLEELDASLSPTDPLLLSVADGYERLGRRDLALAILLRRERTGVTLSYDDKVHIADLAARTGDLAGALARWRSLWAAARLPARTSYLQRQIVAVAAKMGALETIAAELQGRIARGQAAKGELDLLLAILTEQKNKDAVQAAITAFAASGRLDRAQTLSQLAVIQARMKDYAPLAGTLRELIRVDPANADTYRRQLLQNILLEQRMASGDGTPALPPEAQQILVELEAASGLNQAKTRLYAGTIYASAGLNAAAIDEFRRARALAPADSDTLLQLADQMRRGGQLPEAAALLQYVADTTRSQTMFVTAISGLIDTFQNVEVGGQDQRAAGLSGPALGWAQRRVLEWIAINGDDVRLDSLVADLGQTRADFGLQIRAFDESLAVAGDQRAAVLRQLITLNSGTKFGQGGGPMIGDVAKRATYGRRLIALRKQYPPEVYADLARAMLTQDDVAGAERAFAMMSDIAGLVDVDKTRGDAYNAAGYIDRALSSYNLALLHDESNYGVIVAASILRERKGDFDVANLWYLRGLQALIQRQPLAPGESEAVNIDRDRYFPTLIEGLAITWPSDPATAQARLDAWRQTFDGVAALKDGARPLAAQPRLDLMIQANRRLAERLGDPQLLSLEDAIAPLFAQDKAYARDRAAYLDRLGQAPAPDAGDTDWAIRNLRRQANDTGNTDLDLALALSAGNDAEIARLVEAAMQAAAGGAEIAKAGPVPVDAEALTRIVLTAANRLPAASFRQLVLDPLRRAPFGNAVLFDIFRGNPDGFAALEKAAGGPLIADEALIDMLITRGNQPLASSAINRRSTLKGTDLLIARLSQDRQVDFYLRMVEGFETEGTDSILRSAMLHHLLGQSLSATQQQRVASGMTRTIAAKGRNMSTSAFRDVQELMLLDVLPANRPLLLAAAALVAERHSGGRNFPVFLKAYFAGDKAAAYRALTALDDDLNAREAVGNVARPIVDAEFQAEERAAIAGFLADPAPTDTDIAKFHRRFVADTMQQGAAAKVDLAIYYRKLLALYPDAARYVAGLADTQVARGDYAAVATTLGPWVQRHPDDREAATLLGLARRLSAAVPGGTGPAAGADANLDDPDWLIQMINMASAATNGPVEANFRRLFGQMYQTYATRYPDLPAVATVRSRRESGSVASSRSQPADDLGALPARYARNAADGRGRLRELWRKTAPGTVTDDGYGRVELIAALPDAPSAGSPGTDPAGLPALLSEHVDITDELDLYLAAMAPPLRQQQARLYELMAQGLIVQHRAGARADAGFAALSAGTIDDHDLRVLAVIADRSPIVLDAARLQALKARLERTAVLPPIARIAFARVFATSGDTATAGSLLLAAGLQLRYPTDSDKNEGSEATASLDDIVAALRSWRDPQTAAVTYDSLVRQVNGMNSYGQPITMPPLVATAAR